MNGERSGHSGYRLRPGEGPIVLAFPHAGTALPPDLDPPLNARGRALADTDWHVDELYEGLLPDATVLVATHSRYYIDLNRDPTGSSLYPDRNTTGLCPEVDFAGRSIYEPSKPPGGDEIARRRDRLHTPYHDELRRQLLRLRRRHPHVLLFDGHSIRSRLPFLFEGVLPIVNFGSDGGRTCDPAITRLASAHGASWFGRDDCVLDGRFRGGWTTRHHADPAAGVHTLQLELAQRAYLRHEEPPWELDTGKVAYLRPRLGELLVALDELLRGELARRPGHDAPRREHPDAAASEGLGERRRNPPSAPSTDLPGDRRTVHPANQQPRRRCGCDQPDEELPP
ncbi:MAG: N-formylglutamate deformylase [Acidobacteria bacterium]|nr:MAG: N-formylglutamate deformylase [Acidobacteriota bacterium]